MEDKEGLTEVPETENIKEMTVHSSVLARRIPWTEEPGGLQPVRSGPRESDTSQRLNNNKGCSNKAPQTGRLKTTETCYLIV